MNNHVQVSMRLTFGDSLLKLATDYPDLVVLDADVSSSTQTIKLEKNIRNDSIMSEWQKPTWLISPAASR
jgi:transketolase C-terminal domain/subunit